MHQAPRYRVSVFLDRLNEPSNYDILINIATHCDQRPIQHCFCCNSAILHDTIEDQPDKVTEVEIEERFGYAVAEGVLALSKSKELPQGAAMQDSLDRILLQPRSVWCVKLADRVANLRSVPNHWTAKKIAEYRTEASLIVGTLGAANACLSARLRECIASYPPGLPSRSVAGVSDESGHFHRG
jgi:(p)ppGpp synthase/HD superfamily hydrolase